MDVGSHKRPLRVEVGGEADWEEDGRVSSGRSEEVGDRLRRESERIPCGWTGHGMEVFRNQGELLGFWIKHLNRSETLGWKVVERTRLKGNREF